MAFPALSRLPFNAAAFVIQADLDPATLAAFRAEWAALWERCPDIPPLIVLPAHVEWDVLEKQADGTFSKADKAALAAGTYRAEESCP